MLNSLSLSSDNAEQPRRSWKGAVRVIGVAESFQKTDTRSVVVGIVMRGDLQIDGFGICRPTVGLLDSTEKIESMFERISRKDIRAWILGGSIISWFNVVDLHRLYEFSGIPVISVTYTDSAGITNYLQEYFPEDWRVRDELIAENGPRVQVSLDTGHSVFVNVVGMNVSDALQLLNLFTLEGKVPEPVRVARLIASSLRRDLELH